MAEHIAFDQIQAIRRGVTLVAGEDQLTVALHGAQTTTQGFQRLFFGQLEGPWPTLHGTWAFMAL